MPESNQKPVNQNQTPAAGGAPVEAPKPAPRHEEILAGFGSELKARRLLAEKIERGASEKIKQLEARKEEIFGVAKSEMDAALEALKQDKKEKAEFLETDRKEELDRIQSNLSAAEQDLQALKANTTDPSAAEQEKVLAERLEQLRDLAKKSVEATEAEYVENTKALADESAAKLAEIKANYQANMSIIKSVYEEIEAAKKEKETRLKELWSSNLEERVAVPDEAKPEPVSEGSQLADALKARWETEKKEGKKHLIVFAALGAVTVGGWYGVNRLEQSIDAKNAEKSRAAVVVKVTDLKGVPVLPVVQKPAAVQTAPAAAPKPAAVKAAKSKRMAAKPKGAAVNTVIKKEATAVAKFTATASAQAAPAAVTGAKTISDSKAYHRLVLAMRTIWPKITTFSDSHTIFQKSPQYHLQAFCNYIKDHTGDKKNPANMSSEQEAAAGGLLSAIRAAKKFDVLGPEDWDLQELKGILKGGMKADAMRGFTKKIQAAIKAKLAAAKKAAKPAAKVGTKEDRKLMANHLRSVRKFKKSGKPKTSAAVPLAESLNKGATSQANVSVSTPTSKPSQ